MSPAVPEIGQEIRAVVTGVRARHDGMLTVSVAVVGVDRAAGIVSWSTQSDDERFWKYVTKTDYCWIWTGCISKKGYGTFTRYRGEPGRRTIEAHRYAYERMVGPIPDGLVLDHVVCRNKPCIRPDHTEPVTRSVNSLRGKSTEDTCEKGLHLLTPLNVLLRISSRGYTARICRRCKRDGERRRRLEGTHAVAQ